MDSSYFFVAPLLYDLGRVPRCSLYSVNRDISVLVAALSADFSRARITVIANLDYVAGLRCLALPGYEAALYVAGSNSEAVVFIPYSLEAPHRS